MQRANRLLACTLTTNFRMVVLNISRQKTTCKQICVRNLQLPDELQLERTVLRHRRTVTNIVGGHSCTVMQIQRRGKGGYWGPSPGKIVDKRDLN